MAELVDAHGSGPCSARSGGSSPLLGTKFPFRTIRRFRNLEKKPGSPGLFLCRQPPLPASRRTNHFKPSDRFATLKAMSQSTNPIFGARRDQAFPTLAETDIDRMRRFGEASFYAAGEN